MQQEKQKDFAQELPKNSADQNDTSADLSCALCNTPNHCTRGAAKSCWCFNVNLTNKEKQRIALLHNEAKIEKNRCICQNCLQQISAQ